MHVADGWVARNFERLKLAESEEMLADRAYLERVAKELEAEGFTVSCVLAMGEPSDEIVKFTRKHKVDLIAMSTHGHRFISDLLYGSTADKVRHLVDVPVLLLKARRSDFVGPGYSVRRAERRAKREPQEGKVLPNASLPARCARPDNKVARTNGRSATATPRRASPAHRTFFDASPWSARS